MEWRTERQVCRENAKLKSREGRRDPGTGEESRDEYVQVRPLTLCLGWYLLAVGTVRVGDDAGRW